MTRVISFSSGKGGVGKTSLVANLGALSAQSGKKTLLIDGDWSLGKLGIVLGTRPTTTLEKVLGGEVPMEQVIHSVRPNLDLIASPSGVDGLEELTEAMRNHLFFELERVVSSYDMVLLDHSSGIHWSVLEFVAACHRPVIVTTPEPTSYTDAYAIMKLLSKRFHVRHFDLVVSQCDSRSGATAIVNRFIEVVRSHLEVRVRLLDIIPRDTKVSDAIQAQQLFVDRYPTHGIRRQLEQILSRLEQTPIEIASRMQLVAHHGLGEAA